MPEIYPKFEVSFSKAEIEAILLDRAVEVLGKKIVGRRAVVLRRVLHVEGGADVEITLDCVKDRVMPPD